MDETDGSRLLLAGSDGIFGNNGGGAQAQLYINVYPSQDDPTKTLWIFGRNDGDTRILGVRPHYGSTIRSSGNYHARDSWKVTDYTLYHNNKPTNALFNLSPLFSSANHPKDIESITRRLPGAPPFGPFSTNTVLFGRNEVTNAPTMSVWTNRTTYSSTVSASKTIGSIFMNDDAIDEIGIRGAPGGGNLAYTTTNSLFRWHGSGIMDKPIGDFLDINSEVKRHGNLPGSPYFANRGTSVFHVRFYRRAIPEPAEYALVFGLFALAFVIFHRHFQKKTKRGGGEYGTRV